MKQAGRVVVMSLFAGFLMAVLAAEPDTKVTNVSVSVDARQDREYAVVKVKFDVAVKSKSKDAIVLGLKEVRVLGVDMQEGSGTPVAVFRTSDVQMGDVERGACVSLAPDSEIAISNVLASFPLKKRRIEQPEIVTMRFFLVTSCDQNEITRGYRFATGPVPVKLPDLSGEN